MLSTKPARDSATRSHHSSSICAAVRPTLSEEPGANKICVSTPTSCEFFETTAGLRCSQQCAAAGLVCQHGWDNNEDSSNLCEHYSPGVLGDERDVTGYGATFGVASGCENSYGGQICRCTANDAGCSVEPVEFAWVDISATCRSNLAVGGSGATSEQLYSAMLTTYGTGCEGTEITDWEQNADDGWKHITLPWSINWFGRLESVVTVGTNGIITFGS